MLDRNGFITRERFFEFANSSKLADFHEKKEHPTPKQQQMMPPRYSKVGFYKFLILIVIIFYRDQSPKKDFAAVERDLSALMKRRTGWSMPLGKWIEIIVAL